MSSMVPYYERDGITIYVGDNREVLPHIEPVHAVVTDPPYGLSFMGKGWDHQVPGVEFWQAISAAMLPGAHLLAFGGTRTYHRMAVAIEDAGYEIRDTLQWIYGSGFPKSHDVSKAIDKLNGRQFEDRYALGRHIRERRMAMGLTCADVNAWFGYRDGCQHWERQDPSGARVPTLADWQILKQRLHLSDEWLPLIERVEAEREVVGVRHVNVDQWTAEGRKRHAEGQASYTVADTAPATPEAEQWQGWGTALKPAYEPIIMARLPFKGTVAANVLAHGTGAINVDACRVGTTDTLTGGRGGFAPWAVNGGGQKTHRNLGVGVDNRPHSAGRWPANVILDEAAAEALDAQSGERKSGTAVRKNGISDRSMFAFGNRGPEADVGYGDTGGASRFFKVVAQAGCGSKPTGLFQTGTKSTTSTTTCSTTSCPTCNASPQNGTITTTCDCGKITETLTALNTDAASGVTSTSHSPSSSGASQEPTRGTASHANANTCENGEPQTANTTTPTCANIESAITGSRFVYIPKASRRERNAGLPEGETSTHPTVKPLALMRYLIQMVTPPEGIVLDPFMGSGSTLVAAAELGFNAIGIELSEEYAEIAARRVDHAIENRDPQLTLEGIA